MFSPKSLVFFSYKLEVILSFLSFSWVWLLLLPKSNELLAFSFTYFWLVKVSYLTTVRKLLWNFFLSWFQLQLILLNFVESCVHPYTLRRLCLRFELQPLIVLPHHFQMFLTALDHSFIHFLLPLVVLLLVLVYILSKIPWLWRDHR